LELAGARGHRLVPAGGALGLVPDPGPLPRRARPDPERPRGQARADPDGGGPGGDGHRAGAREGPPEDRAGGEDGGQNQPAHVGIGGLRGPRAAAHEGSSRTPARRDCKANLDGFGRRGFDLVSPAVPLTARKTTMKRSNKLALAAALAGGAAALLAVARPSRAGDPAAAARADDPRVPFEKYKLDNGLEVILHQDNSVPLVAVDVWYHVGSGDETPGKSGFAHLFEHMLFQGSKNVGEDKHFELLRQIGVSTANGSTSSDRTNYYEVVPSHQLETALWLESDRMGYFLPLLTEPSLKNQIEVVRNERRQNYDNRPCGNTLFAVSAALYPAGHPYRYLTIGRHEDLASSTLEDVR